MKKTGHLDAGFAFLCWMDVSKQSDSGNGLNGSVRAQVQVQVFVNASVSVRVPLSI